MVCGWSRQVQALKGKRAVVYSMQVNNPRPDVKIKTIDIVRESKRTLLIILAITLGNIIRKKIMP